MSKTAIGFITFFGIAALLVVMLGMTYFKYANMKAGFETSIESKKDSTENALASFSSKAKDILSAAKIGIDAQTKIIERANQARYGGEGSKAVVQFITEQNLAIPSEYITKLQVVIDDGREEFKQGQDELLDQCRAYKLQLKQPWSGFWLNLAGAPSADFDMTYNCDIVSNSYAADAMKTKRAEALDLSL